ncbi:WbqC family protein [Pseudomonas sp. CCOS 191]|uniref:WbqC family protein n=1 Tax=Pseudomonas sp. CCOS 191 TaxID=1649877 RepID=UPI000624A806|nr:WbqC family protein [Pseudomonas sp. CCOS 191]CRI59809.1 WbqC-like family protein [Pseudomonas sp. CCOS 191]
MKLAVMQPYLFPYLGYFQLIQAVDEFVIYDDVNFIKGGWINRNRILSGQGAQLLTLPLQRASPNLLINQIRVDRRHKILQTIRQCYSKAPCYKTVYPLLEEIITRDSDDLVSLLDHQLRSLCEYLGLSPRWRRSSMIDKDNELRGQDKVLALCQALKATHYINLPGGKGLYAPEDFSRHGLKLSFIQPRAVSYGQFGNPFQPNLSIIDVMMFNNREQCAHLLQEYDLD